MSPRPKLPRSRELKQRHARILAERAVESSLAKARGYLSAEDDATLGRLGWARGRRPAYVKPPALAIPVYSLTDLRLTPEGDSFEPTYFQLRPDRPAVDPRTKKPRKYLNPIGQPAVIDVNPLGFIADAFEDRELPLVVVEGIPKGDAGWSVGLPTVSIQGVWNFTSDSADSFRDFVPDLRYLPIEGREVLIAFDADAWTNPDVKAAARELARVLARRAATVKAIRLPHPERKFGLDDFIASLGDADPNEKREAVLKLVVSLDELVAKPPPLTFAPLADVEPREVEYLWKPYIPRATFGLLDGAPSVGKTMVALALAAALSRGGTLPAALRGAGGGSSDARVAGPVTTLYITTENSPATSLRPRLDKLGADVNLIFTPMRVEGEDVASSWTIANIESLREAIQKHGAKLVVIDPLLNYIGADRDVDTHKDASVRPLLSRLLALAETEDVTILGIRHLRKEATRIAVYAGGGSVAFAGTARFILIASDWEKPGVGDVNVLAHAKNSDGPLGATLEYAVSPEGVFEWKGVSDVKPGQLTDERRRGPGAPNRRDVLKEKLEAIIAQLRGRPFTRELLEAAANDAEASTRSAQRALRELGWTYDDSEHVWHSEETRTRPPPAKKRKRSPKGDGSVEAATNR